MLLQNSIKKGPRCWHGHFWLLPTSRPLFKKIFGVTTLPTRRVLLSPPYIPAVYEYDEF
jgi:hypothetical protein